jgi:hypothetical protein
MRRPPSREPSPASLDQRATSHGYDVLDALAPRMMEFCIVLVFAIFISYPSSTPNNANAFGLAKFLIVAGRGVVIGAIIRLLRLRKGKEGYQLAETFLTAMSFVAAGHFIMKSPILFFLSAMAWAGVLAFIVSG